MLEMKPSLFFTRCKSRVHRRYWSSTDLPASAYRLFGLPQEGKWFSRTGENESLNSPSAISHLPDSAIGLTGEIVLYLHDPRRRNRQAAHGSRFKVKFVRPPSKG